MEMSPLTAATTVKMQFTVASLGLALAAGIFLLVWPVYSGFDGVNATRATLLQVNGPWALLPVFFPVFVALLPVVFKRQFVRIIAAVVLVAFSFIAGFSIGLFYIPAAVVMVLAACVPDAARLRGCFW